MVGINIGFYDRINVLKEPFISLFKTRILIAIIQGFQLNIDVLQFSIIFIFYLLKIWKIFVYLKYAFLTIYESFNVSIDLPEERLGQDLVFVLEFEYGRPQYCKTEYENQFSRGMVMILCVTMCKSI